MFLITYSVTIQNIVGIICLCYGSEWSPSSVGVGCAYHFFKVQKLFGRKRLTM